MRIIKKSIILMILVMLLAACSGKNGGGDSRSDSLTWGSSSLGSQGYIIIEALASTANKHIEDYTNSSVSTAGSAENIVLLNQGEIDFGQATSDVLYAAKNGNDPFDGEQEFAQVFAYGYWSLPIIVPMDSEIQSIEDLKGKTLNVGTNGGSSSIIANEVLTAYGMEDEVKLEHLNYQEAADALKAGQIDATVLFHMAGNLVATPFQELAQSMEFRPLEMDQEILQQLPENNEGLQVTTTLQNAFDFYTKDVQAPGMTGMLVAHPDVDADKVYEITKTLYEHAEDVRNISPELGVFALDYAVEGLVKNYPVHPGAAKFFKEKGLWKDGMVVSGE